MAERACVLFKETRISTDSITANVINLRLPSHRTSASYPPRRRSIQLRRSSISSQHGSMTDSQRDIEALFGQTHLAKAASIYFRRAGVTPRSIYYRIVEEWEVLAIQAADVAKETAAATGAENAYPVIRFHFPDKIRENCVGFVDVPDRDEVLVYVMTVANTLYTLTLKGEILRNGGGAAARGGRGGGIGLGNLKETDYCRTYQPNAFSLHSPHFLVAVDHERILVSLQDGVLLRLDRGQEDDDMTESVYHEKTFSDSSYFGIVRNKLPWVSSGTSRYKDTTVSHSTVISTAIYKDQVNQDIEDMAMVGHSSTQSKGTLLFTVSINHTLKVWLLEKGSLLHACDLMNEPQTSSNIKTVLDPAPASLLAIMNPPLFENHLFYIATYSPASTGTFKFWAVLRDAEDKFAGLEDMYSEYRFTAVPPTKSSIWIISDFKITSASNTDPGVFNMWILWKSNTSFKIQNLMFHLNNIPGAWDHWATSTTDSLHVFPPSKSPPLSTSDDVTDGWMEWIFYPDRFPDSVIEAALDIYEQHFSRALNIRTSKTMSLQGRVGKIVASAVEPQRSKDGSLNYEKYRHEVALQWDRFVRLCVELDRQRGEALSLVADSELGFIWAVNADGITALRECTELEMIVHNQSASSDMHQYLADRTPGKVGAGLKAKEIGDVLLLVRAATDLMNSLPLGAMEQCVRALQEEVLQDPVFAVNDRMWALLDRCLTGKIPDTVLDKIEKTFAILEDPERTIRSMLSSLYNPEVRNSNMKELTAWGIKVWEKVAQEIININHEIFFNLAFLICLASFPEDGQRKIANAEALYAEVIAYLKEYEVLKWMAKKSIAIQEASTPEEVLTATLSELKVSENASETVIKNGSVLQLLLPEYGGIIASKHSSITACVRFFLGSLELGDYQKGTISVASALLSANTVSSAAEFIKFLPNTYLGAYAKARILLASRDESKAVVSFKKAATGLASANEQDMYPGLQRLVGEAELVTAFGTGLPQYFIHVAKLFEDCEGWGYVAEFCRSALLSLGDKANDDSLKMGILSKMFQASLQVLLFDEAYTALIQYTNRSLQLTALSSLVEAMVEQNQGLRLCSYPFIGLQDEVDETLQQKCSIILDVTTGPPFHKVLYAWRIQRGDYRGAASILHQRLQRLKTANVGSNDPQSKSVTDGYLALLNALSCVDEGQAWILSSNRTDGENIGTGAAGQGGGTDAKRLKLGVGMGVGAGNGPMRRQVLTLRDLKAEYQRETDRQGLLLHGGFFV